MVGRRLFALSWSYIVWKQLAGLQGRIGGFWILFRLFVVRGSVDVNWCDITGRWLKSMTLWFSVVALLMEMLNDIFLNGWNRMIFFQVLSFLVSIVNSLVENNWRLLWKCDMLIFQNVLRWFFVDFEWKLRRWVNCLNNRGIIIHCWMVIRNKLKLNYIVLNNIYISGNIIEFNKIRNISYTINF